MKRDGMDRNDGLVEKERNGQMEAEDNKARISFVERE
jgi:hypothetical protein